MGKARLNQGVSTTEDTESTEQSKGELTTEIAEWPQRERREIADVEGLGIGSIVRRSLHSATANDAVAPVGLTVRRSGALHRA